jgi:hypothetical protein
MPRSARVQSIDALRVFAAAVRSFGDEATGALSDLEMQVNRALEWIRYEQKEYWTEQIRRAEAAVAEARLRLEHKQILQEPGERRSFWEEKKALEAAKRRLAVGRQKLDAVRRWTHLLDREIMEFKGGIAPLAGWLQTDLHRALALLKRCSGALESYLSVEPPARGEALPAGTSQTQTPAEEPSEEDQGVTGWGGDKVTGEERE